MFRMLALAGLLTSAAVGVEYVGVSGSSTQYATVIENQVGDDKVALTLTGAAMRTRIVFNVYTIGSYVKQGVLLRTGEELAAADVPKQLHLVMERDVDGRDLAAAFRDAIRMNYPAPAFDRELASMTEYLKALPIRKGEHFWLTHVPGVGLHGGPAGKPGMVVRNVRFSRAVWEMYFGKVNVSSSLKQALLSRL